MSAPPPPPPDIREWKSAPRKIDHLQVFSADGKVAFESFWRATGRYRIRGGWFGAAILEREEAAFENDQRVKTVIRWRRAMRGEITPLFGIDIGDYNG